jgi:hypothetical protein
MNLLRALLISLLALGPASAGTITRSHDFTPGDTIRSSEVDTEFNTIYNEFNGSISAANLAASSVDTSEIVDGSVTTTDLASTITSTITAVSGVTYYRRPNLQWISVTTVDAEVNVGTATQTCVYFRDGPRCVTENTASTSQYRRFIITESAALSGTHNSGLRSGYVETGNTWYSLYYVKTTDANKFVIVGDTVTPTQSNFAALNTAYGTDGWVYAGLIGNGSDGDTTTDILAFDCDAGWCQFFNNNNGGSGGIATPGIRFADTSGATSLSYTMVRGFGNAEVPDQISFVQWTAELAAVASTHVVDDSAGTRIYVTQTSNSNAQLYTVKIRASESIRLRAGNAGSIAMDLLLSGFQDKALGYSLVPNL